MQIDARHRPRCCPSSPPQIWFGRCPRLDVPIVMAQGRLDQVAPGEAAQRFHDSLAVPSKQLVWFERSAHTPHLEEPAKFGKLLMNVAASQLADT